MRRATVAVLGLLVAACGAAEKPRARQQTALSPAEIARRTMPSVVFIRTDRGSGSGFIIAADGLIATNLHVVAGAQKIRITLADDRVFEEVTVVGHDAQRDLVVLRVTATGLPALRLQDGELVVGQRLLAIGHPVGMQNTVSDGLVSALRSIGGTQLIQMTAPISPGSSGGPVLDDRGRVIGVATAQRRDAQNLNFAMPARYLSYLARERGEEPITSLPDFGMRSMFAKCSSDHLVTLFFALLAARDAGDALTRDGRHRDALEHYRLAATDIVLRIPTCAPPRRTLALAVVLSDRETDDARKAARIRIYMDAILRDLRRALR